MYHKGKTIETGFLFRRFPDFSNGWKTFCCFAPSIKEEAACFSVFPEFLLDPLGEKGLFSSEKNHHGRDS